MAPTHRCRRAPPPSFLPIARGRRPGPRPTPPPPGARALSAYGYGEQWTGALSRGPARLGGDAEAPEVRPEELEHFGEGQALVPLLGMDEDETCLTASAGWGHTALLASSAADDDDGRPRLRVCGRPHDFQAMLRLRRLPPFVRDFCVRHTLPAEGGPRAERDGPSTLQRIATYLAGENPTFREEDYRRYSNVPTLLEVELPDGEVPAVEGEAIERRGVARHAAGGVVAEHREPSEPPSPPHARFQNTLSAGAGVTAVISKTGTLYTFGLNQRGA